ncbi:energy transducer TonB [Nitrospira sp. KM1]|uniref:energy transducer TonB n=1 Tax=Nitrospira sp. KM1 TaxID=1936990 RepID=UPI001564E9A1|nr:TonB family protein [Nitrospira sp. KM1]
MKSCKRAPRSYKRTIALGWSVSALVHVFAAVTAAFLGLYTASKQADIRSEPFRWEVSLIAAPQQTTMVAEGAQAQVNAPMAETDRQSMPDDRVMKHVAEYSDQAAETDLSEAIAPPVVASLSSSAVPRVDQVITEPDSVTPSTAMTVPNPAASFEPPPDIATPVDAERLQVETQIEIPKILQRPQAMTRNLINRPVLPDYGWLRDTLRNKLERVKVYPPSAKASHAQGRVVVQVNILGDGSIVRSEIEESSGHPVLDQAALDALRAASPLRLVHQLDGHAVVMLVPLNYQLE